MNKDMDTVGELLNKIEKLRNEAHEVDEQMLELSKEFRQKESEANKLERKMIGKK